MKVYKKRMMQFPIAKGKIIFISHPLYSNFFNKSKDAVKINKWSLMHSLIGLNRSLQGSLVYIAKENESKFKDIEEVIIGMRVMPYSRYIEREGDDKSKIFIMRCLR